MVTIASPSPASLRPCCLPFTALPGWAPGLCCYCSGHSAPGPPFPAERAPHCDEQGPVWPATSVPRLPKALLRTGAAAALLQAPPGHRAFACFLPAGYCPDSSLPAFGPTQVSRVSLLPWPRYRKLLHHLLLPFPCLACLYHIATSEILDASAVWLPPQK